MKGKKQLTQLKVKTGLKAGPHFLLGGTESLFTVPNAEMEAPQSGIPNSLGLTRR